MNMPLAVFHLITLALVEGYAEDYASLQFGAAWLHGCKAARLQGCTAARLQGCTAARLHGCKAADWGYKAARLSELVLLHMAVMLVLLSCNSHAAAAAELPELHSRFCHGCIAAAATAEELEGLQCRADGPINLGFLLSTMGLPGGKRSMGLTSLMSLQKLDAHRTSSLLRLLTPVAVVMECTHC